MNPGSGSDRDFVYSKAATAKGCMPRKEQRRKTHGQRIGSVVLHLRVCVRPAIQSQSWSSLNSSPGSARDLHGICTGAVHRHKRLDGNTSARLACRSCTSAEHAATQQEESCCPGSLACGSVVSGPVASALPRTTVSRYSLGHFPLSLSADDVQLPYCPLHSSLCLKFQVLVINIEGGASVFSGVVCALKTVGHLEAEQMPRKETKRYEPRARQVEQFHLP